jgi:S-DNA-T family DNA segregation ATPase FtsK/SpoIIIE
LTSVSSNGLPSSRIQADFCIIMRCQSIRAQENKKIIKLMARKKGKKLSAASRRSLKGRRRKPFKLKLRKETVYTFSSVALFVAAGIIVLSFSRQGPLLAKIFDSLSSFLGWGILFTPFLFLSAGLMLSRLKWQITRPNVFVGTAILLISFISLTKSGKVGFWVWDKLVFLITSLGAFLVLAGLIIIGFVITFNTSLEEIILFLTHLFVSIKKLINAFRKIKKPRFVSGADRLAEEKERKIIKPEKKEEEKEEKDQVLTPALVTSLPTQGRVWKFPPLSLLEDEVSGQADRGDINKNADIIEKTLDSFGVSARVVEVNLGPAVTQYALEIALGTKLSKITALSNDLALALAAPTGQIRIEAPIPGRSLVGVEVPNRVPEFVSLKKMLTSEEMKKSKSKLVIALGLDVSGRPVVDNIDRMPHVLIAGATGSGKSVCINSFIASILFRTSPDEVKFILIDPKRVELTRYDGIPHLLTPVIYEPGKVLSALKWAIDEMDRRYKLFAEVGARNIDTYNELSGLAILPYIIIFIDELADIMLFAPAEVEDVICRIAQMARATGIHLVISTQRPSVDVITGLIKANIPCRLAFNVSSQVDSRVIIDMPGAEKLLGRGDMLYIPPDQAKPTRIQGTFLSDPEVQRLISFLRETGIAPVYTEEVTQVSAEKTSPGMGFEEEKDDLFEEALRVVCRFERASASLLQRRLKVGYARAARILDQLERSGIIGPAEGSKPREILIRNAEEYFASQTSEEKTAL